MNPYHDIRLLYFQGCQDLAEFLCGRLEDSTPESLEAVSSDAAAPVDQVDGKQVANPAESSTDMNSTKQLKKPTRKMSRDMLRN